MNEQPQPWHRLPDESEKAWAAFCCYRDLPPTARNIRAAYQAYIGPSKAKNGQPKHAHPAFKRWAIEHRWAERAVAFDDYKRAIGLAATQAIREQIAIEGWASLLEIIRLQNSRLAGMDEETVTRWSTSLRGHLEALGLAAPRVTASEEWKFKGDD